MLLISSPEASGSWSNTCEPTESTDNLSPLYYNGGKLYSSMDTTTEVTTTKGGYLSFNVYFLSAGSEALTVYLESLTLTNTTGVTDSNTTVTLPSKDILSTTGLPLGDTYSTYSVDVLRTLLISVESTSYTSSSAGTSSTQLWDPEALATVGTDSLSSLSGWNAHTYYNAVTGNSIATTDPTTGITTLSAATTGTTNAITVGSAPVANGVAGTYLKVTFKVFINGWDLACFDACQGQSFQLDMKFTCETTNESYIQKKTA